MAAPRARRQPAPAPRQERRITVTVPLLHPGQADVVARASRFNVVMCGRRWGKTELGKERATDALLPAGAPGRPVGWFAPTNKVLLQAWEELKVILHPVTVRKSEVDKRLELLNGGVLECWTLERADAGRSRKYARVIVDEAGLVRDLKSRWQADIRPTLTDFRGDAWFLGTPKGRQFFFNLFQRGQSGEPGYASFRAPTASNPWIPGLAEEIADARRDMPPDVFAQEYEGVPQDNAGNPFGMDAIAAIVGPRSLAPPYVWGWDLASSVDWTVGVALDRTGRWCDVVRFQKPWPETRQIIHAKSRGVPALVDSTGVGDPVLQELQGMPGGNFQGFLFTGRSKQELMLGLRNAIANRAIVIPDVLPDPAGAGAVRAELESFEYQYREGGVRYAAPDGLHDDAVMALALAVHHLHAPRAPIGGALVTL